GIVVLVNKWDLVDKETNTARDFERDVKARLAPFNDVPVVFISVKEKQRIFQTIETAVRDFENCRKKIPTSRLNDVMLKVINAYHAPVVRGHAISIKYVSQLPTHTPTFAFFSNFPNDIKQNYKSYLENKLRENFDFTGVPIRLFFRKK